MAKRKASLLNKVRFSEVHAKILAGKSFKDSASQLRVSLSQLRTYVGKFNNSGERLTVAWLKKNSVETLIAIYGAHYYQPWRVNQTRLKRERLAPSVVSSEAVVHPEQLLPYQGNIFYAVPTHLTDAEFGLRTNNFGTGDPSDNETETDNEIDHQAPLFLSGDLEEVDQTYLAEQADLASNGVAELIDTPCFLFGADDLGIFDHVFFDDNDNVSPFSDKDVLYNSDPPSPSPYSFFHQVQETEPNFRKEVFISSVSDSLALFL